MSDTELEQDANPDETPATEAPPPDEDSQEELEKEHEGMEPVPDTPEEPAPEPGEE